MIGSASDDIAQYREDGTLHSFQQRTVCRKKVGDAVLSDRTTTLTEADSKFRLDFGKPNRLISIEIDGSPECHQGTLQLVLFQQ